MFEFKVAAQAARSEDVVEVTFPEPFGVLNAHRPTTAQAEILGSQLRSNSTLAALEFVRIIFAERGDEVVDWLRGLLLDGKIDREDLIGGWGQNEEGKNEQGLLDGIIRQFSGRPTEPSTGSSRSQSAGGRRSTARTPGPGSIPSDSPSTGS
jgi:hypothetical protein